MGVEDASNLLLLFVNGKKVLIDNPDPQDTLIHYLRRSQRLTGTKLGCAEGGCGACTVMVSKYDREHGKIIHYSVNSCLAPLVSLHGQAVTTIEGIGSTKTRVHEVQRKLAESHGSQCGFCTPGIVMSMYTLLRNNPKPSQTDMEKAFEGNLCRCTGYRPILQSFRSYTQTPCGLGAQCCRNKSAAVGEPVAPCNPEITTFDPSQEPIFPPELKLTNYDTKRLEFHGEKVRWYRPTNLSDLLKLKKHFPQAKLVCGNTEIGVETKFKNMRYPIMIAPTHILELNQLSVSSDGVRVGASCTLTQLDELLHRVIAESPEHETRIYRETVEMLRWFAGHQIRNVSSVAGNLMTASPISDLNPLYLAAGVTITLRSQDRGERNIKLDHTFFISYRKIAVEDDEVLVNVQIPRTRQNEYFGGFKQAHRKEDDIAIVNAGFRVVLKSPQEPLVEEMSLAFGGMALITKACPNTANSLVGRLWDEKLLEEAQRLILEEVPLSSTAPGGMIAYRKTLTLSFFYKFYLSVKRQITVDNLNDGVDLSAMERLERDVTKGIQVFESADQSEGGDCGKPLPHTASLQQCTGEAIYVDDIPIIAGELYMALVFSGIAKGKIDSVDSSAALSAPGVVDFISHVDVPGSNVYRFSNDELIFAVDQVMCLGHVVGAILADSQTHAQAAAKLVKVKYQEETPIFTIEEAIAADSYINKGELKLWKGDMEEGFNQSDFVFEGEMRSGGQEHFYLETQAVLAIPGERGEMEIFSSTQNPAEAQQFSAAALGVPRNRIHVRVKRMGGAFGGKSSRPAILFLPAVIAAAKHGVPVRCMLDRDEDMMSTGNRHSVLTKYKVGVKNDGRIMAVKAFMYNNAGCSLDLSLAVMERGLCSFDNAYTIPNMWVQGFVCRTNLPSNTAFRGFGGPQGMMAMENIMDEIAHRLDIPHHQVREAELMNEGDVTHYGQAVVNCNVRKCWDQVLETSQYLERQKLVNEFNRENRWRKRGICAIPTKYGISFTLPLLNHAGALVHIYLDGSVLVSHGGTEMGQGLNTKMIQVASRALGISADLIHIQECSTSTVPNTSPTAASVGSDLNGMAVLNACEELNGRLDPIKKANPEGSWTDWIVKAHAERISLSSTGYYGTPGLSMDWSASTGNPFNYFSFGAAVSEVEIDCLTGDHQMLRTDIVMDVGKSLNPAIDIGQIEGGFIMGYGLFCLEQLKVMKDKGHLLTRGPGAYKIPGFGNIPQEFNVTLLKDAPNVKAVYSSKAIGEPPVFLSASVFYAIKSAIYAARKAVGDDSLLTLFAPCTPEKIRMACTDQFTKQFEGDMSSRVPADSFYQEP